MEQRTNCTVSRLYLGRTSPRSELPDLLRWDSWSESEESEGGLHEGSEGGRISEMEPFVKCNTVQVLQGELTDHREAVWLVMALEEEEEASASHPPQEISAQVRLCRRQPQQLARDA